MAGRMSFCLSLASILMVLSVSSGEGGNWEENLLINGIDPNYPPFAFVDGDGKPDGLDVKAMDWIAKEMGFQVLHLPLDWDMMLRGLRERGIDLIASGMNITEKGAEEVNYTISYWSDRKFIVADSGSDRNVDQILDHGNRLGALRGSDEAEWIEENLIKKAGRRVRLIHYDEMSSALKDMKLGKIKGFAVTASFVQELMKKNPIRVVGTFGMPDERYAYAVRKEDTALLETLNRGLQKLMASPYWQELMHEYME